jgi:transcriptional regulator with XRE-family HTH domain
MNGSSAGLTMVKPKTQVTSRVTREALVLLGQQIKQGRLARKLTAEELSTRAGISRALLRRIERGDPGCSIGAAFEAAVIAGVPLFVPEPSQLGRELARSTERLSLLPKTVRLAREGVKDDF